MGLLRTYGFMNAKVRAMRSALLQPKAYKALASAMDYRDFLQLLSQSGYASVVEEAGFHDADRLELALEAEGVRRLQAIYSKSSKPVSGVLNQLLKRYEAERLKWMLRFWFLKRGEINPFLQQTILYPLPVHEILDAPTFDDVLRLLGEHPFLHTLAENRREFEAKQSLFPIELAIDREQIKQFLENSKKMNRRDQRIIFELSGIEIDMMNLSWIERFKHYYQLSSAEILTRLLPGGQRLGPDQLRHIVSEGKSVSIFAQWEKNIPIPSLDTQESTSMLQSLELFLAHVLLRRAHRAFMEFPFSMGAIMGYYILLRIEMMNIRTLIQAKSYRLSADKIDSCLVY